MFAITVENDFRDARAYLEFRWYTPEVTRFEAYIVGGRAPPRSRPNDRIRVYFNGNLAGAFTSKSDAVGQVRTLLAKVPPACRDIVEEHASYLFAALDGSKP